MAQFGIQFVKHPIQTTKAIPRAIISAPKELAKGVITDPSFTVGRIASQVAISYGISKGVGKVVTKGKVKTAKIEKIDTRLIAQETMRVDKTSMFDVVAKAKVSVKRVFRKPKVMELDVGGRVVVKPSPTKPDYFIAESKFIATKVGKKKVVTVGKGFEIIKPGKDVSTGISYTQIKVAPKSFLDFITGRVSKTVVKKPLFVEGVSQPPLAEGIISLGRSAQILKKGKAGVPFTERVIGVVQRLPEEVTSEGGFSLFKPGTIPKPKVAPSPTFAGLETVTRQAVKSIIKTEAKTKIPVAPLITPSITREVTPSKYEGTGLYERTDEVSVVTPKGMQLQVERLQIKESYLMKPKAMELFKTAEATKSKVASMQLQGVKEIILQKEKTVTLTGELTAQVTAQAGGIPTKTLLGEAPITPPIIPFGFTPSGWKQAKERTKAGGVKRELIYTPSLVAQELGITATAKERKQIGSLGILGVRPLPVGLGIKRKKALFQDIGI